MKRHDGFFAKFIGMSFVFVILGLLVNLALLEGAVYVVIWVLRATGVIA